MREESESEKAIRRLLLGESGEEERQRVEESFMTDPEYREKVLMAEDDLVEDYLDGALSERERERFRAHFLSTPRQRRKVRLARSLGSFAAAAEVTAHSPPAEEEEPQHASWLRRLVAALGLRRPVVYVPVALTLVAAVLLGSWLLVEFRRAQQLRAREEGRRVETERELARLNDPSGARTDARVFSKALPPLNVRGEANTVPRQGEADVVELRLLRGREEYVSYAATLQRIGAADRFSVNGLRAADTPGGRAVPVRIPARLLTPGAYRLTLTGVTADGRREEADEYTFYSEE
jgi:anti-sigma factor RsiW